MTRKVKMSFLILVWSIVVVQMFVNNHDKRNSEKQAITAFSIVDENVTGETVKGYAYFGKMDISDDIKENMLKNLAYKLGIKDGYDLSKGQGDGFTKVTLTKEGKYATTLLRIVTISGKEEPEQHIMVQIDTAAEIQEALALYHRVEKVFEEIEVEGNVSLEVEMEQKGNLKEMEGEMFASDLFQLAKAKVVDSITENGIYTVYGYTQHEKSHLNLSGKRVNIQMVMVYDEVQDKTYIKMGLPIVNSSY